MHQTKIKKGYIEFTMPKKCRMCILYSNFQVQDMVQLEGLGKLKKNSMTTSGLELATFRLVA
jgi:hypothetical protein